MANNSLQEAMLDKKAQDAQQDVENSVSHTLTKSSSHLIDDLHNGLRSLGTKRAGVSEGEDTLSKMHKKVVETSRAAKQKFKHMSEGRSEWRKKLAEFLESKPIHMILITSLLIDLFAVVADILESLHTKATQVDELVELLSLCKDYTRACDAFHPEAHSQIPYIISMIVLTLFQLYIFLLLVAWGRAFFCHAGYVLDLIVVTTAIILEASFDSDAAGLLAFLTLWRLIRVMHGIFEVTDETFEAELHKLSDVVVSLQEQHNKDKETMENIQREVDELRSKRSS